MGSEAQRTDIEDPYSLFSRTVPDFFKSKLCPELNDCLFFMPSEAWEIPRVKKTVH